MYPSNKGNGVNKHNAESYECLLSDQCRRCKAIGLKGC